MPKPYSNDVRKRVVDAILASASCRSVAKRFNVSASSAIRWAQRFRETESVAPARIGGHRPLLLEPCRDFILARIKEVAFQTVSELRRQLADCFSIVVSNQTVWRFLKRLGLSDKKTTQHAAEQDRPDVAQRRQDWQEEIKTLDFKHLIFVDETGFKTNMATLR